MKRALYTIAFGMLFVIGTTAGAQQWQFVSGSTSAIYYDAGNAGIVGIGTTNPTLQNGNSPGLVLGGSFPAIRLMPTGTGGRTYQISTGTNGQFTIVDGPTSTSRFTISSSGNVGVANPFPAALLDVNGSFRVRGDAVVDGNIGAKYQDLAEWVPATVPMRPGTVVVLDPNAINHVMPSSKSYDTSVAGVVSEKPGVILGEAGDSKAQIATTGRVRVRVDATAAPIAVGDLLVTGTKPGTAMKSVPVDLGGVALHRPGTVVGKALEPLAGGTGEILVLLSLQ